MVGEETGRRMDFPAGPIQEIVERLGYECVHVGIGTESSQQRVRVLIDSLGGITVSDCETVSKAVNRFLDENDVPELGGRYYLEVSSPGVERPLFTPEHYGRFRGREARIRLTEPVEGRKALTGRILEVGETSVVLFVSEEEREIAIPFANIKSGALVFRGFEPKAPVKRKKGAKDGAGKRSRADKDNGKHHEEEL